MSAAPIPSMIDSPRRSTGNEWLIDATNAPTTKTTAPPMNMRLRPKRSPMRPPVTVSAASIKEYAEITHCSFCRSVCSSRISVESDTLSSVESMMMIASASESTPSAPHLRNRLSRCFGAARTDIGGRAFKLAAIGVRWLASALKAAASRRTPMACFVL